MRSIALAVVVLAGLGCKEKASSKRGDAADAVVGLDTSGATDAADASETSDAAACDCHVTRPDGGYTVLTMSWSCYCASGYADGCTRTLASQCTGIKQRFDYPGCGLTALKFPGAFGPYQDVYDQDGKLVGAMASSDSNSYVCPTDRMLSAFILQAGQFPAASCDEVASSCPDAGS